MTKPKAKQRDPILDYHEMIEFLEEKYNFQSRDYLNSLQKNHQIYLKWIGDNYPGFSHVMDAPEGSKKDWPKDSPEMAKRIEINTAYNEYIRKNKDLEVPYLDFWHIHCDSLTGNGSELYICLDIEEYQTKDKWCAPILEYIKAEFAEYVEEDCINTWVEW